MEETLVLKNITKSFNGDRVLDGVSFTITKGEHVSLIGESMSGKSTLLKIIIGLVPPDSGEVLVFGQDMARASEREKMRLIKDIEMQFQSGALFDSMTVGDNIRFVLNEKRSLSAREKEQIVERLLKGVNLWQAVNKYPFELSGGMQKRVAVARALSTSPQLAMFDEPAAGLDPVTSVRIIDIIKSLAAEDQSTLLVATTSVHTAREFSDRFILLKQGRIHVDDSWRTLISQGDDYTRKFLSRDIGLTAL